MNREHWKSMLPIITAFAEGKRVQFHQDKEVWINLKKNVDFQEHPSNYRIAPEPKLRPWKSEEVPLGAWVRYKKPTTHTGKWLITGVGDSGEIGVAGWYFYTNTYLLDQYEHSTDGGKTWLPCGVLEGGE